MATGQPEASIGWLFFSPSGRISRQPYGLSFLFWIMLNAACLSELVNAEDGSAALILWFLAFMALTLASAVSLLFLSIKRLHDMGYPGPIALVIFIPAISIFAVLAFMIWPGMIGHNDYGTTPNRPKF